VIVTHCSKATIVDVPQRRSARGRPPFRSPGAALLAVGDRRAPEDELLKAGHAHWSNLATASPVGEPITVLGWADASTSRTITEPEQVDALDSKLIWTRDYVSSRFQLEAPRPVVGAGLRAHPPPRRALTVAWHDDYGGCILVGDVRRPAADPTALPSQLCSPTSAFRRQAQGIADALGADAFR